MDDYLDVVTMSEYVDADRVRWTRRGTALEGKMLERRTRNAEIIVRHHSLGKIVEIPAAERGEFWSAARHRMAMSQQSAFVGAEFKDGTGRHMVLIDESC